MFDGSRDIMLKNFFVTFKSVWLIKKIIRVY